LNVRSAMKFLLISMSNFHSSCRHDRRIDAAG
jgi:hypothetical protein